MSLSFFKTFGVTSYDFSGSNNRALMTAFTKHIGVVNTDDVVNYTKYTVLDGERPEQVSYKLYGDPKYHWTFFLLNDSLKDGLHGWPLSFREFDSFIEAEYDPYVFISGAPISDEHSESEAGNHKHYSRLPLSPDYAEAIEIGVLNGSPQAFVSTGMKFVRKDFKRCGLILTRPQQQYSSSLHFGEAESASQLYFKAKVGSELAAAWWAAVVASGYPVYDEENRIIAMDYLPAYSYANLKNSTYQFYTPASSNQEEDTSRSHYDAIQNDPLNVPSTRITWYEYEKILNERKQRIVVAKPAAIRIFESAFESALLD